MTLDDAMAIANEAFEITPQEINNGYCADWATIVSECCRSARVESDECYGHDYTHTFIKHCGRFYDAECLEGVDTWQELPIFNRQQREGYCRWLKV